MNTIITLNIWDLGLSWPWILIDPRTIMHLAMIIWLAHRTGTMSFSIDVLRYFPPALSYFLKDKCPRNAVCWSAAKSGEIPEKVIFYWAFLIRFPESFGIIRHFCSNRKTLTDIEHYPQYIAHIDSCHFSHLPVASMYFSLEYLLCTASYKTSSLAPILPVRNQGFKTGTSLQHTQLNSHELPGWLIPGLQMLWLLS